MFNSTANIKVIGVGGAGGNAVNRMVSEGLEGVEFIAVNTDAQVLEVTLAGQTVRLGENTTRGLGAGGDPEIGASAAKESERELQSVLDGADMVFITAGMGGGTGSGAAPVVSRLAKQMGILTVAVVTKPFTFEGARRRKIAEESSLRLAEHVDTLIIVPNDRLLDVLDKKASMQDAFAAADEVLRHGVQGISDIILNAGLINVDFADVRSVMKDAGVATMGMGTAMGEQRARLAAEAAATSPMLETGLHGAKKLLVNITSGSNFSLSEVYDAMEYLQQFVDPEEAEIFMGHVIDESVGDAVKITVIAAGIQRGKARKADQDVFPQVVAEVQRHAAAVESAAQRRPEASVPKPIDMDEIEIDIPTFLRRQRLGS